MLFHSNVVRLVMLMTMTTMMTSTQAFVHHPYHSTSLKGSHGVVGVRVALSHLFLSSTANTNINQDSDTNNDNNNNHHPKEKNAPRHDVGNINNAMAQLTPEQQQQMMDYQQYQQQASKLDFATDVRTLIQNSHGFAVMSTFSKAHAEYPSGSVVGFAVDTQGRPLFCFSGMSSHTQDILVNPKCSLTIASKQFKGAADGRVNLMGTATLIRDTEEIQQAQQFYQQKHPGAFWTTFGDFNWFRMSVEHVRFVGGFARAGTVTADEYTQAQPDPIAAFGPHIAQHMNDDHSDATIAIVQNNIPGMKEGPTITAAEITSVDSLGMFVKVTRTEPIAFLPQQFKVRVPFPRIAQDRGDVKKLIVELMQSGATTATTTTASNPSDKSQQE